MRKRLLSYVVCVFALVSTQLFAEDQKFAQHLQDVSVTIKAGFSEGSGVIVTREIEVADGKKETINFVLTAAHVVSGLRSDRAVIEDGKTRKIVEFKDAQIVKELVENGRRVGEMKMTAKVISYSDAEHGEDIALLMIRKRNFIVTSAKFYLEGEMIVPIGTQLYHVGSLLGQAGSNSMTTGIVSQVGRVLDIGNGDGVVFDQTTVTAFPGSSGGGVWLKNKDGQDLYVGMLVRGAGETFNLTVPIRRMHKWAKENNFLWVLDATIDTPSLKNIKSFSVEPSNASFGNSGGSIGVVNKEFPFLIRRGDSGVTPSKALPK